MSKRIQGDGPEESPDAPLAGGAGLAPRALPGPPSDEDADSGALEAESIGRYLSRQRELRGISTRQLADLTRIPIRSLERLEAGHFDDDVDGFVRGFVRTVAEALGLDPHDALARMLAEPRGELDAGRPMSVLLARSFVGLFAVVLLALAFGIVKSAIDGEASAPAGVEAPPMLWRSDPVRALAEAHAAHPALTPQARATDPPRQDVDGAGSIPGEAAPDAKRKPASLPR